MACVAREIATDRLVLRQWRAADAVPFAAMNADPEVMRFFRLRLDRTASDKLMARLSASWREDGFSYWALEEKGAEHGEGFIGFCGLDWANFPAHLMPCVEVGWRLVRHAWGKGYATEAAQASLAQGFGELGLGEIIAFSVAGNARSRAVMERLGMRYDTEGDFEDEDAPEDSPLRDLVVYRLSRAEWGG